MYIIICCTTRIILFYDLYKKGKIKRRAVRNVININKQFQMRINNITFNICEKYIKYTHKKRIRYTQRERIRKIKELYSYVYASLK